MKSIALKVLFFLFIPIICSGQDNNTIPVDLKKNALYFTAGIWPMYTTFMASYERSILQPPKSFISSIGLKISAAYSFVWTAESGMNYSSNFFALLGRNSNLLELGAGILYAPWTSNENYELFPCFNLSYRYHNSHKPFIFRAGLGWPEAAHLSIGFSF